MEDNKGHANMNRERFSRSQSYIKTIGNAGVLRAGEIVFPREKHNNWLSNTISSAIRNINTNNIIQKK